MRAAAHHRPRLNTQRTHLRVAVVSGKVRRIAGLRRRTAARAAVTIEMNCQLDRSMPDLLVRRLVKNFPTADGTLPILQGIDLELTRGDAVAVTGPSGAGKSTLLYILGALDEPTSGDVELQGQRPHKLTATEQAAFRNRHVGFVFQDHHLLPQCTVLENVLIPAAAGYDLRN